MIARIWRGWTSSADADAYLEYVERTGMTAYRSTPGNLGAHLLLRDDPERAVFYPEDDRFLVDRETSVTHFEARGGPAPDSRDRGTGSPERPR